MSVSKNWQQKAKVLTNQMKWLNTHLECQKAGSFQNILYIKFQQLIIGIYNIN